MTGAPRYEPYLDSVGDSFRWRLGLRPLDLADWLQYDEHAERELAYKRRLLDQYPGTVFAVDPQLTDTVHAASSEIYRAIFDAAPERFRVSLDETANRDLHPLDAAGRMTQEDLVVMVQHDGDLVCGGGSVCFPNRWHLPAKIGRSMAEIHTPVPHLNDQLGGAIDSSLARLTPERSFWRLGWTILDTDELYQPVDASAPATPAAASAADYWLRVERETLRRFPATGAVLFTIRTYLSPLPRLAQHSKARLAELLATMDPEILTYKSLGDSGSRVAEWLRHQSRIST